MARRSSKVATSNGDSSTFARSLVLLGIPAVLAIAAIAPSCGGGEQRQRVLRAS